MASKPSDPETKRRTRRASDPEATAADTGPEAKGASAKSTDAKATSAKAGGTKAAGKTAKAGAKTPSVLELPLVALRETVIFPEMIVPLQVGRATRVEARS